MSILPPEVRAGYVYNRVLRAIGDRPEDEDRFPDGIPAKGTVTFTPKNSVKQVVSNNTGVTVTREPVVCTIHQGEDNPDLAGLLIDEAGSVGGVWLVVGEWTVSYQFEDRYSNVPNQDIVVTEDHTEENPLDVALVAGITPSPTIKFVVNEQVYIDTLKAKDDAETARDGAIQASQTATTAAGIADTRATDANTSATTAADILAQTQALGITVDTSVGTRVFVGDTMIYGDTGWRDISSRLINGWQGSFLLRRINSDVYLRAFNIDGSEATGRDFIELPDGFRWTGGAYIVIGTISIYYVAGRRVLDLPISQERYFTGGYHEGSRNTDQNWPTSLPGTPA